MNHAKMYLRIPRHSVSLPLMNLRSVAFGALIAGMSALVGSAQAAGYKFKTIDTPGYSNTFLYSVNNYGQAVGMATNDWSTVVGVKALGSSVSDYSASAYGWTELDGINDYGTITGSAYANADGAELPFFLVNGRTTPISTRSDALFATCNINNYGDLAGSFTSATIDPDHTYAFTKIRGRVSIFMYPQAGVQTTQAFGINNYGQVAGFYQDASDNYHGFVLSGGRFGSYDYPGAVVTRLYGINDDGTLAGYYMTSLTDAEITKGFIYKNGRTTAINVPGAIGTAPQAINNKGQVVGIYLTGTLGVYSTYRYHGFIATPSGCN